MKLATWLLSASLLASVPACVATESPLDRDGHAEPILDGTDGKADSTCGDASGTAAEYFALFAYQVRELDGSDLYIVAGQWATHPLITTADGEPRVVHVSLYFLPENRVIVDYAEWEGTFTAHSETLVVSRSSVDEATRTLTIDGVGTATPVTLYDGAGRCGNGMTFTFTDDIASPGLAGVSTTISRLYSSAYVVDPDHLDQIPTAGARARFEERIASGEITVLRK